MDFTRWLFQQPRGDGFEPTCTLVVGWREAKPCFSAIEAAITGDTGALRPDSRRLPLAALQLSSEVPGQVNTVIGKFIIHLKDDKQQGKAAAWAKSKMANKTRGALHVLVAVNDDRLARLLTKSDAAPQTATPTRTSTRSPFTNAAPTLSMDALPPHHHAMAQQGCAQIPVTLSMDALPPHRHAMTQQGRAQMPVTLSMDALPPHRHAMTQQGCAQIPVTLSMDALPPHRHAMTQQGQYCPPAGRNSEPLRRSPPPQFGGSPPPLGTFNCNPPMTSVSSLSTHLTETMSSLPEYAYEDVEMSRGRAAMNADDWKPQRQPQSGEGTFQAFQGGAARGRLSMADLSRLSTVSSLPQYVSEEMSAMWDLDTLSSSDKFDVGESLMKSISQRSQRMDPGDDLVKKSSIMSIGSAGRMRTPSPSWRLSKEGCQYDNGPSAMVRKWSNRTADIDEFPMARISTLREGCEGTVQDKRSLLSPELNRLTSSALPQYVSEETIARWDMDTLPTRGRQCNFDVGAYLMKARSHRTDPGDDLVKKSSIMSIGSAGRMRTPSPELITCASKVAGIDAMKPRWPAMNAMRDPHAFDHLTRAGWPAMNAVRDPHAFYQ